MVTYQEYRNKFNEAGQGIRTDAPTHIDIELASVCNFRCPMCPQAETFVDWHKGFMPTDMAIRLLDEAKGLGVLSVKLNWRGESTLHPEFGRIVRRATTLGFVDTMLNTNGAYSDVEVSSAIKKLNTVIFSIDTLDEQKAKRIRPGKGLGIVLGNFEEISIQRKFTGAPQVLRINFTRQKENWDEVPAMEAFSEKHEAELYIKNVFPRNAPSVGEYYPEEKFEVLGRKNCGFPFQRLVIAHDGRVAPCCVPWNDTLFVGDVNKQSLIEIWNSPELKAIQDAAKKAEYQHPTCVGCTSWASYEYEVKI